MDNTLKSLAFTIAASCLLNLTYAQKKIQPPVADSLLRQAVADSNLLQYAVNKRLPRGYEKETLEALAKYPELKEVPICFCIKKSFATLKTRPTFFSMFMPRGHRSYVVTISNKTAGPLMPLLLMNLGHDARLGVIGHELGHVQYFASRNAWQCVKIGLGHLSPRYLDRFEYHTDIICIDHGLGKDLEAWSSYIRKTMHTVFWRGAGYVYKGDKRYERYMNPSSIEKQMQQLTHNIPSATGK